MSFFRSTMRTNPPASISAMSPVRSHPASSSTAAVSSGRFQYPFMTWGPRMQSSPGVPAGSAFPASSITRHSVLGTGTPTEPVYSSRCKGLMHAAGEVSVSP